MTESAARPYASLVVGFKDWGLERLELSLRTIRDALVQTSHEIVIADYGSTDGDAVAEVAARSGARYERVSTHGEWSRSRALNAGVRTSRGGIILATDADMLFSPGALDRVVEQLDRHPHEIVILQCRDLPTGHTHETVAREGLDWERFAAIGHLRPRWGMGGLVGIRRDLWGRLRGWDERMHTYGGEDMDLARRAQRLGARIDWLDEPGIAMYHVWHPSSGASAARSPDANSAVAANRRIRDEDQTFARNITRARYLPDDLPPLVTVVVDGESGAGSSDALERTLVSILGQSILDLEVLVSGSLPAVGSAAWGPRVRGLGDESPTPRGTFTAVARAGEIWADAHLETLLSAWIPGTGLMSSSTAELLIGPGGESLGDLTAATGTVPSARATIVRTSLLPTDAELTTRGWPTVVRSVAATGAGWVVRPEAHHVAAVTAEDSERLRDERIDDAVALTGTLARCSFTLPDLPAPSVVALGIRADAVLDGDGLRLTVDLAESHDIERAEAVVHGMGSESWTISSIRTRTGDVLHSESVWSGYDLRAAVVVWRELDAFGASTSFDRIEHDGDARTASPVDPVSLIRTVDASDTATDAAESLWIAASTTRQDVEPTHAAMAAWSQAELVVDRVVEVQSEESIWVLTRLQDATLAEAWTRAASLTAARSVSVIELRDHDDRAEATR
ncbi:glycosyltransferase [Brachybacterium sp. DNPG3]